jgi:photosystem II stability/assembly factor-like uncharacterized protein
MLKAHRAVVRILAGGPLIGLMLAGGSACAAHRAVSGLAADRTDRSVTAHATGDVVSELPGSWKRQRTPHLRNFRLQEVSCSPDGQHCLAVGVFCLWATCPGKRAGAVLATADGGSVWLRRPLPPGIRFGGYFAGDPTRLSGALSCAGPLRCVVLGWQRVGKRSHMAILLTTTGGRSWVVINASRLGSGMNGISCPTVSTCFAAGSQGGSVAVIKTTDGGLKWAHLRLPRGTGFLTSISCASAVRCTAVGAVGAYDAHPFAVSTATGGRGWTRGIMPRQISGLITVSCPSSSTCFAVGSSQGQPVILITTNGGKRWRERWRASHNSSLFTVLAAISCPSATTCAAAGITHPLVGGPTRLIVETSDGGSSWPTQTRPAGLSELLSVSCSRTLHCVAVGNWWFFSGSANDFTKSGALIFINRHI